MRRFFVRMAAIGISFGLLAAQSFQSTGSMNEPRESHTATLLNNGTVLVTGGFPSNGTAEIYNPGTGTWRYTLHNMQAARDSHSAALLNDGRVLIVGGNTPGTANALISAEIFDPTIEQFTLVHPPNYTHGLQPAVLLADGRVLIIGGDLGSEIYDPANDTWTPIPAVPVGDREFPAIRIGDGTVLALGGDISNPGCCITPSVYRYNPTINTVTQMASMLVARVDHTASILPNGQIVIVGGTDGSVSIPSTEVYDPAVQPIGQSQLGFSLHDGRRHHTATVFGNGDLLVTGGYQAPAGGAVTAYLASAELRDHTTGNWNSAGTMSTARNGHTATLLSNGQVLVAGGGPGSPTNTAEIWNPPAVQTGTINVTTNLAAATFTIVGPATYQGGGTSFIQPNAPVGMYIVTYHDVPKYRTPPSEVGTLSAGQVTPLVPEAFYTPLTLTACPKGLTGCPQSLSFTYKQGSGKGNATQEIGVVSDPVSVAFLATTDPASSAWLTVGQTSRTTPATLTVSVASTLKAQAHPYSGTIFLTADNAINSPLAISVSVTVTEGPPPPTPPAMQALKFPVKSDQTHCGGVCTPMTVNISSVFDHRQTAPYKGNKNRTMVEDFRGEIGVCDTTNPNQAVWSFGSSGTTWGFKQASGQPFMVNGHYTGGGGKSPEVHCGAKTADGNTDPSDVFLFYSGHPGYDYPFDYSANNLTGVFPAISGCVTYKLPAAGGPTVNQLKYHTLAIIPLSTAPPTNRCDSLPNSETGYVVFYLHLASYVGADGKTIMVCKSPQNGTAICNDEVPCANVAGVSCPEEGDWVSVDALEPIAVVGDFANGKWHGVGAHLHFEVDAMKSLTSTPIPLDPYLWNPLNPTEVDPYATSHKDLINVTWQ